MTVQKQCFVLIILALFTAACSDSKSSDKSADGRFANNDANADGAAPSFAGRWVCVISQGGSDFYSILFDIQGDGDDSYVPKMIGTSKVLQIPNLKIMESEFTGRDVHLVFGADGRDLDFRGEIKGDIVWGTLESDGMVSASRLVSTDVKDPKSFDQPRDPEGWHNFEQAFATTETLDALVDFCEEFPTSPLALEAHRAMFQDARKLHLSAKKVNELAKSYLYFAKHWGPRMVESALITMGESLAANGLYPERSLELLNEAEQLNAPGAPANWDARIAAARDASQTGEALQLLASENQESRQAALETLRKLHSENPLNPLVTNALAVDAAKRGATEEAIQLFGMIVALPTLEQQLQYYQSQGRAEEGAPAAELKRLWNDAHRNTQGLDEFLGQIYTEWMHKIVAEIAESNDESPIGDPLVCELFTGTMCPPCVAADVAVDALVFDRSPEKVLVLTYHEHIPGPDPLANPDSKARMGYYAAGGTPTVVLNGRPAPFNVGGGLDVNGIKQIYDNLVLLSKVVESEDSGLTLQLKANMADGELSVSAEVVGNVEANQALRLRTAIVEDDISFVAENGIRHHRSVVRGMPGGPSGVIRPAMGDWKFEKRIDWAGFKSDLIDSLEDIEDKTNYEFKNKPLKLEKLRFVAFVQDDHNHRILTAASIPVTTP